MHNKNSMLRQIKMKEIAVMIVRICYRKRRRHLFFMAQLPLLVISCVLLGVVIYQASKKPWEPRVKVECNGGYLLARRIQNYTRFTGDLNNSFPRQFDSGLFNFSYKYAHVDQGTMSEENIEYNLTDKYMKYNSLHLDKTKVKHRGYIHIMAAGQELSQCTKHLFRLCFLAATSHRKVVAPRMKRGRMGWENGVDFGDFFDLPLLNQQLSKFGYSELATQEEYLTSCKSETKTVIIVIYSLNRLTRGIKPHENNDLYRTVLELGWVECSTHVQEGFLKLTKNTTEYFCVHYTMFQRIEVFNEKILRNSKCAVIPQWNELGDEWWNNTFHRMKKADVPKPRKVLHWFSTPSRTIVDEVNQFRAKKIQRPYAAIHIRGVKFRNKSFIQPCFDVAMEFVNALRRTRKVKTLFLSTDMSEYGGITNHDKVTHHSLAEQSGAVIYDPSVTKRFTKKIDRWQVSLAEVRLLSQSDHLITIGHGSFNIFILNRFHIEHLKSKNWTWTTLCHQTAQRYQ